MGIIGRFRDYIHVRHFREGPMYLFIRGIKINNGN